MEIVYGYKAFNNNLKSKDQQFEVGKEYIYEGELEVNSNKGFHFCENPMDLFIYHLTDDRFCEVEGYGEIVRNRKTVASSRIKIIRELTLDEIISKGIEYEKNNIANNDIIGNVLQCTDGESNALNSGNESISIVTYLGTIAGNSGNHSIALTTAISTTAFNSGNYSKAISTESFSNSITTGKNSIALGIGYGAKVEAKGEDSVACALGLLGKAKANETGFIILGDNRVKGIQYHLHKIYAAKVGDEICGVTIEPNTYYWFDDGELKYEK